MKILFALRLFSGLERSVAAGLWVPEGVPTIYRLLEQCDRPSHRCRVILTRKAPPASPIPRPQAMRLKGRRLPFLILPGVEAVPRWLGRLRVHVRDLIQGIAVWRQCRRFRPDLVYVDRANILLGAVLARLGYRVVLRIMGITPDMWRLQEGWRPSLFLWRWAYRAPFAWVLCTEDGSGGEAWMRRRLHPAVPRAAWLNGVDRPQPPETLDPRIAALPDDRLLVLFVGRLDPLKDPTAFVAAALRLFPQHADRLLFVLIGEGGLAVDLHRQVAAAGAESMIRFLSALPHAQVGAVLERADVYVSLNRGGDISNANLEALRYGVCLVMPEPPPTRPPSRVGQKLFGPAQVLRLPQTDLPTHLAEALLDLADRPERRRRRADAARTAADAHLSVWQTRIDAELARLEILPETGPGDLPAHGCDVAVVIANLSGGGAQRVVAALSEQWAVAGRRVTVITLASPAEDRVTLAPQTERIVLGGVGNSDSLVGALIANARRIQRLRRALRRLKPAAVLSFVAPTNVLTVLATRGLGLRCVISERNDPARQSFGRFWDGLRRWTYGRADQVTANSRGALDSLAGFVPPSRLALVPNPVRLADPETVPLDKAGPVLLAVGRLHRQKAYDLILPAFAAFGRRHPDWQFWVLGEGRQRQELEALTRELGLAGRVRWIGHVADPTPYYATADLFVLASRHEGMPNALLEAMAHGVPSIVSDCSPGPLERVVDGESGLVVPCGDVDILAEAFQRLAEDPALRRRLGQAGRDRLLTYWGDQGLAAWNRALGWDGD